MTRVFKEDLLEMDNVDSKCLAVDIDYYGLEKIASKHLGSTELHEDILHKFNIKGTVSGRFSASKPSMPSFPKYTKPSSDDHAIAIDSLSKVGKDG